MKNKIRKILENNLHAISASIELEQTSIDVPADLVNLLNQSHFQCKTDLNNSKSVFYAQLKRGPLHISFCFIQGNLLMTAIAIAAATTLATISGQVGLTISVLGMPYEDFCKKNQYLENHIFKHIHAAIMVYPATVDLFAPCVSASTTFEVHYEGRESHASADPQHGINANDALVISQVAIGRLRQALHSTDEIYSTILKGGIVPNVIPADAVVKYLIRSQTINDVKELKRKVLSCLQAGAIASRAKMKITIKNKIRSDTYFNQELLALYKKNAKILGRRFEDDTTIVNKLASCWVAGWLFLLSKINIYHKDLQPLLLKDFSKRAEISKISLNVPFICPTINISHSSKSALFDAALAIAWTAIDLTTDKKIRNNLLSNPKNLGRS
ncbi:MAG: peptidase dimerization domain-containing protein [Gammaproteobacteria bacterium]|nr:peptidase dimerization domain-containing protein [Gammaproteobacteria bacterium]MCW5583718.1 peptidase dimerization domain-containing protein [Gammaproteobacteria bacterium]